MTDSPRFPVSVARALRTLFLMIVVSTVVLGADKGKDQGPDDAAATSADIGDDEAVVSLAAYNVKTDRIEDFGIRIVAAPYPDLSQRMNVGTMWFKKFAPVILTVTPNTAAEKAGLQPGERILESDGRSTVGGLFSTGKFGQWSKSQKKKWADVSAGKTRVTWTLRVESPLTKAVRTVELVVPTAAPRWGASMWRRPPGRQPSVVAETGPLAENSRIVLDNGIATLLPWPHAHVLEENPGPRSFPSMTGYEWRLENERCFHRMIVAQLRGRTWVFLQTDSPTTGRHVYLTSPSGVLEKAWQWGRKENIAYLKAKTTQSASEVGVLRTEEARAGFEHELDLWTTKMRKLSPRWPLELTPGFDPDAIFAVLARQDGGKPVAAAPVRVLSADFLKLPMATPEQQALFADAYGKLGAEPDQWAYTETSRNVGDKRVLVTRVDPSQHERCTLLLIDGRPPTASDVEDWRNDGGDIPKPLGDLPPLASLVDLKDLRVNQDDPTSILFELAPRGGDTELPIEKVQALARVNKGTRGFEDITVKLRDAVRVAGVVDLTQAGLHVRFETLDPAHAPQPVHLQGGGTARFALVKISRDFETTRTEFRRVVPLEEMPVPVN